MNWRVGVGHPIPEGITARKVRSIRTPEFEAEVAVVVVQGQQTVSQLATLRGVHPVQITQWKKQLLAFVAATVGAKPDTGQATPVTVSFERIGRLAMELEWLKKN